MYIRCSKISSNSSVSFVSNTWAFRRGRSFSFLVQTGLQLRGCQAKLTKLADSKGQLTEMERIDEGRSGSPAQPGTGSGADAEVEIMEDDDTAHGAGAKEGAGGSARQGGGSAPKELNPLYFLCTFSPPKRIPCTCSPSRPLPTLRTLQ